MSSPADLRSIKTAELTEFLTDQLIKNLPEQDKALESPLEELRKAIWPSNEKNRLSSFDARGDQRDTETQSKYQQIIASVPEESRAAFMEHVAQMGHLRQLASLVARDNFFQEKYTDQNKEVPGSGSDFISASKAGVDQLITAINGVVFNPVFTAHPTNNNTLPSMQALGDIGDAITAYRADPSIGLDALAEKVAVYAAKPITPITADGKDTNLSAADETTNMLHFMGEIYDQLPATLQGYDSALQAKAAKNGETYDPLRLAPQYKFDSWGSSGDKDGNKMVNATTTLDALMQHREKALGFYLRDLNAVLEHSDTLGADDLQTLTDWKGKLSALQHSVDTLHARLKEESTKPGAHGTLNDADFNDISQQLAAGYAQLQFEEFPKALAAIYPNMEGAGQQQMLGLIRGARIFGENFGRLEYRETAEEYARVVKLLVGNDYPFLSPSELVAEKGESAEAATAREAAIAAFIGHVKALGTDASKELAEKLEKRDSQNFGKLVAQANDLLEEQRTAVLTTVLENPEKLAAIKALLPEIAEKGAHQEYGDSPYPIAYQSIKRMELARDFDKSIVKQVLAECQAPSNVLEAKLLMEAVEKDGKKPVLGIVPLFEDPSLLATAHTTMKTIVENPVYAQHLKDFLAAHPDECAHTDTNDLSSPRKITQEVQFAHSDNGRRGGMPAARAYIYEAHENLQKLGEELGMSFREFHGGSASDPYRGGTRSYIGMIRDYNLQDSFKLTLQGGDLLNMFNYQGSIQRYLGGVLQYCASQRLKVAELGQNGDTLNGSSLVVDELARNALKNTLKDYQHRVFKNTAIGALFGALADLFELISGAVGTRKQRKGVGFEHTESKQGDSTYLDPNKIRTITFSELLQHNQINPTWVGAFELTSNIRREFKDKERLPDVIKELQEMPLPQNNTAATFLSDKNRLLKALKGDYDKAQDATPDQGDFYSNIRGINPAVIQYMYNRSPAFRDVMDRMAFGLATTNLSAVEFHHHEELDKNPQARNFLRTLKVEYVKASTLVYAAMTGKFPEAAQSESVAVKREEAIAAVHSVFEQNDITQFDQLPALQAQLKEQGLVIDLEALRTQPGFSRAAIDRAIDETLNVGKEVAKDGLNLERVRNRILDLPRLNHLKRDVEDNMALLDFTNSFKDVLRQEYHQVDDHIPHKVEIVGGGDYGVQIYIGESNIPVELAQTDKAAVEALIGQPKTVKMSEIDSKTSEPEKTVSGYTVKFDVNQADSGARYVVQLHGQDAQGNATDASFAMPHDAWLKLSQEIEANGLPPEKRDAMDAERAHLFRVVHCAADTATHVYYPTAGDRLYSQALDREASVGIAA